MVQERKGKALRSGAGCRNRESGSNRNGQGEREAQMKRTLLPLVGILSPHIHKAARLGT